MKQIPNSLHTSLIRDLITCVEKITGNSVAELELKRRLNKHIRKLKHLNLKP